MIHLEFDNHPLDPPPCLRQAGLARRGRGRLIEKSSSVVNKSLKVF